MEATGSLSYYLGYQFLASLILAAIGLLVGLLVAWIIWGNIKYEFERTQIRNRDLRKKLESLQNES